MINWIVGGLIVTAVIFFTVRFIRKLAKGESTCSSCCAGCTLDCRSRYSNPEDLPRE